MKPRLVSYNIWILFIPINKGDDDFWLFWNGGKKTCFEQFWLGKIVSMKKNHKCM